MALNRYYYIAREINYETSFNFCRYQQSKHVEVVSEGGLEVGYSIIADNFSAVSSI